MVCSIVMSSWMIGSGFTKRQIFSRSAIALHNHEGDPECQ